MNEILIAILMYLLVIYVGAFFIWSAFDDFKKKGPTFIFAVDVMLAISMIVNLVKFIMR